MAERANMEVNQEQDGGRKTEIKTGRPMKFGRKLSGSRNLTQDNLTGTVETTTQL